MTPPSPAATAALVVALLGVAACAPHAAASSHGAAATSIDCTGTLTHFPVDLGRLFAARTFAGTTPLHPFFDYSNTSHAEGPRKWYLYGSLDEPLAVYLPARAALARDGIRRSQRTTEVEVGGETCLLDVQTWFRVDATTDVRLFFMHLCLRQSIAQRVEAAGGSDITFAAGTHLGWIYHPPWQSLDFGVEDRRRAGGDTTSRHLWWFARANPFDYLTTALQHRVLAAYAPAYAALRERGDEPYSDLTDSNADIDEAGTIWGVWFKDDLRDPLARHGVDWSIVNFVPRHRLHAATFWRVLRDEPALSGLYTENGDGEREGTTLYAGATLGRARVYLWAGEHGAGTLRLESMHGEPRTVQLRYRVIDPEPAGASDDRLELVECNRPETTASPPVYFRRFP